MDFDFDQLVDRRGTNSIKWSRYPADALPLWVADMDFLAPPAVREALRARVEHGIFGYEMPSRVLTEAVAARLKSLYGWQVPPEAVIATPGVIAGFHAAVRTVCRSGEGLLIQPPVYPPFLALPEQTGLTCQLAPLSRGEQGSLVRYEIDWPTFEAAFDSGGNPTRMFLLCNPHNPTGQAYGREDLERMAGMCLERGAYLCSDEIHSELLLAGSVHTPIASLSPEIAARTVTLIAPSKTFNIPGLFCAFAVIPDEGLRARYRQTVERMALHVNSLGLAAAEAAYSGECDEWLTALRGYLTANRDYLAAAIASDFPTLRTTLPQATYLAWLDCHPLIRAQGLTTTPQAYFLEKAHVALSEGKEYGPGGDGFVRLNFGCPRSTLEEALSRLKTAVRI